MATFKVISTGSQGNAYIVQAGGKILLLELGLPFKEILNALSYDISKVVACVITHSHGDHSMSADKAKEYQLRVLSPSNLQNGGVYRTGGFTIRPLQVPHGGCKCYAYIISHEEFGNMLFATDLSEFPYKIKGIMLNHIMIECNYDEEIIIDNAMENNFNRSHSENHLSLTDCIKTIRKLHSPALQNIVLLHLSHSNADPKMFSEAVGREIGTKPFVAEKGLEIELNKEEF